MGFVYQYQPTSDECSLDVQHWTTFPILMPRLWHELLGRKGRRRKLSALEDLDVELGVVTHVKPNPSTLDGLQLCGSALMVVRNHVRSEEWHLLNSVEESILQVLDDGVPRVVRFDPEYQSDGSHEAIIRLVEGGELGVTRY